MKTTKIIQYVHRPNSTELGQANTHETYLLVDTKTDLSDLFPIGVETAVKDNKTGTVYDLKSSSGNGSEFRINQMGPIYRDYSVMPGDELTITHIETDDNIKNVITVKTFNRVVIIVDKKGAEIINIERLSNYQIGDRGYSLTVNYQGRDAVLDIAFLGLKKKRTDSPTDTAFYSISCDNVPLSNNTYYLNIGDHNELVSGLKKSEYNKVVIEDFDDTDNAFSNYFKPLRNFPLQQIFSDSLNKDKYLPYLTALRTKPFMLLAGISGTGKSRIVRELAKACWKDGDEEYGKNNPRNFCMVQVKPNWHDSTELFGYVSRISGKPEFVAGDFLKFVVKAWEEPNVPYFLCLDEMNLAPVEQYFAEYLSVIESRKSADGIITTDPLFKKPFEDRVYDINIKYGEEIDWYQQLVIQLTSNEDLQQQFYKEGITIPQNLFVVGTVNMDETTFSFSRKVLDRAMTIEMNEVDLYGGLDKEGSEIGYIGNCIIGTAAEGKDVYAENKELCNQVIAYLEKVNNVLDKTPFKIAYRTRNEFLLYAVNRQLLDKDSQLWQTLDEMTSMKILSRIEGDSERTKEPLNALKALVEENLLNQIPEPEEGKEKLKSITDTKIEEMLKKLRDSGYTSYWA